MMNIRRIERQCTQLREAKPTRPASDSCTLHQFGARSQTTSDTDHEDTRTSEHERISACVIIVKKLVSHKNVSTRCCDEHVIERLVLS